jgi:hypothetical protein
MALSKREQRILYLTVAIVVGTLLYLQGIDPILTNWSTNQDVLEGEKKKYEDNVQTLNTAKQIEEGFKKIEATFPEDDPDREPEQAFSEEIIADAQSILPGKVPAPGNPTREEIKGVEGYEFLTFAINVEGELENVAQLLKGFDQKGYLIKEMKLSHAKNPDDPNLRLALTMARIVKVEEEEEKRKPSTNFVRPGAKR